MVNGIALYGLNDGYSYNGANIFQNLAAEFEKYDFDACYGEATSTTAYHRKSS